MAIANGSAERDPLLERPTSPSSSERHGKHDETTISTSRGAFIVASVGLLIFLQGMHAITFCTLHDAFVNAARIMSINISEMVVEIHVNVSSATLVTIRQKP